MVFRAVVASAVAGTAVVGAGPFLAAVIVVGTVVVRKRQRAGDRVRDDECAALAAGLETVVGELRVGAHPSVAAATAASDLEGAAARAFAVCSARSRLGGSAADGLRAPESVIATELAHVAAAWQVAEQHGLALADLLATMRADLLSRKRFRDRTIAALAGPRATATVLAALPLLGIALGQLLGATPLRILLTPGPGAVLLPLGTALISAGLLWTDTITRKVLI
ncbi:type II secretion system F family protein [Nocardia blacklockiae]|uniref:type II secretion system F family protein n=1 Tax=Nocardia blacklockiae TaxID=480036 RepID=UPI002B4B2750|nr:type II secretion system F family protein [Nocardia blacklockiae]